MFGTSLSRCGVARCALSVTPVFVPKRCGNVHGGLNVSHREGSHGALRGRVHNNGLLDNQCTREYERLGGMARCLPFCRGHALVQHLQRLYACQAA